MALGTTARQRKLDRKMVEQKKRENQGTEKHVKQLVLGIQMNQKELFIGTKLSINIPQKC